MTGRRHHIARLPGLAERGQGAAGGGEGPGDAGGVEVVEVSASRLPLSYSACSECLSCRVVGLTCFACCFLILLSH